MADGPKTRRGLLHRVPRWAKPLVTAAAVLLGVGAGYLRIADPFEGSQGTIIDNLLTVLVIALGLGCFWGAATVTAKKRARLQEEGNSRVRLIAKLPVPALRVLLVLAGVGITTLGVATLLR